MSVQESDDVLLVCYEKGNKRFWCIYCTEREANSEKNIHKSQGTDEVFRTWVDETTVTRRVLKVKNPDYALNPPINVTDKTGRITAP